MTKIGYFTGCKKPKEAAKYAGVSERTLKSWYAQGLPHIKMNDRQTLVEGDDLKEFMRKKRRVREKPATIKEKANELLRKTIGE